MMDQVLQKEGVYVVVLGTLQDGGLPHVGCFCPQCEAAWRDPEQIDYVASVAIVDARAAQPAVYLVDATPDIKYQLNLLRGVLGAHPHRPQRLRQPDGIFLTHAHMGHIGGLPQLSFEAMSVTGLPVYASQRLCQLLRGMPLWSPLTSRLELRPFTPGEPIPLAAGLTITAVPVPHRDEWEVGTFAFQITGPQQTLLYLPDVDHWQWEAAAEILGRVDIALVDGSFYSRDELGGRTPVAHPLMHQTLDLWLRYHLPGRLVFTHFNHTNPTLRAGSVERRAVLDAGAHLAQTGQIFQLG